MELKETFRIAFEQLFESEPFLLDLGVPMLLSKALPILIAIIVLRKAYKVFDRTDPANCQGSPLKWNGSSEQATYIHPGTGAEKHLWNTDMPNYD